MNDLSTQNLQAYNFEIPFNPKYMNSQLETPFNLSTYQPINHSTTPTNQLVLNVEFLGISNDFTTIFSLT